jgi:hypothetical protein
MASATPFLSQISSLDTYIFSHVAQYLSYDDLGRFFSTQNRAVQQKLISPGVLSQWRLCCSSSGGIPAATFSLLCSLSNLRKLCYFQQKRQIFSFGFDISAARLTAKDPLVLLERITCHDLEDLEITISPKAKEFESRVQWNSCRALFPKLERLYAVEPQQSMYGLYSRFWRHFLAELPVSLKSLTLGLPTWELDLSVLPPSLTYLCFIDSEPSPQLDRDDSEDNTRFLDQLTQQLPTLQKISLLSYQDTPTLRNACARLCYRSGAQPSHSTTNNSNEGS